MTDAEALEAINNAGLRGLFEIHPHAVASMAQRGAAFQDVRHALATARTCRLQSNGRWFVPSRDLDGDDLDLVIVFDPDVLVITVY